MGNHIVTGSPNFGLDDIELWCQKQAQTSRQTHDFLSVPPEVDDRFQGCTHNLKAFRFFYPSTLQSQKARETDADFSFYSAQRNPVTPVVGGYGNSFITGKSLPALSVEPVDLRSSNLRLHHTDTYLLISVHRVICGKKTRQSAKKAASKDSPLPFSSSSSLPDSKKRNRHGKGRGTDAEVKLKASDSLAWASGMIRVFTPRGLATSLCERFDGGSPMLLRVSEEELMNSVHTEFTSSRFAYTLHVLKGVNASPLAPCEATLVALRLDEYFSSGMYGGQQLLEAFFFNFGPDQLRCAFDQAGGGKWSPRTRFPKRLFSDAKPHPIARLLIDWQAQLFGGAHAELRECPGTPMSVDEMCERNSLLQALDVMPGLSVDEATPGGSTCVQGIPTASSVRVCLVPPATAQMSQGPEVRLADLKSATRTSPTHSTLVEVPPLKLHEADRTNDVPRDSPKVSRALHAARSSKGSSISSRLQPTPLTLSSSYLLRKSGEYGSTWNPDACRMEMGGDFLKTPKAPRYTRPPQLTTFVRLSQKTQAQTQTQGRSSLSKSSHKDRTTDVFPRESYIPPLDLSNNLPPSAGLLSKQAKASPLQSPTTTTTTEAEAADVHNRARRLLSAAPEASEVLPCLFVGGEEPARNRSLLLSKGITAVVNTVAFAVPNLFTDIFQYLSLCTSDCPEEPITSLFPVVNRFIDRESSDNGGKVFVHCQQGVSRSCSFVIAYLMWRFGMCYDRAYELVRSKRNICSPNAGFYVKLRMWERHLERPVLNRAYAYCPYTNFSPLPFVFHLALDLNLTPMANLPDHANVASSSALSPVSRITEEIKVLGGLAQLVHEGNPSPVLDTRLCYGFIIAPHVPFTEAASSASLDIFFVAGSECDPAVAEQARQEWLYFLHYNYYTSEASSSVNNQGLCVRFFPIPGLHATNNSLNGVDVNTDSGAGNIGEPLRSVRALTDFSELEDRVNRALFQPKGASHDQDVRVCFRWERDARWDGLLAQPGLIFEFVTALNSSTKMQSLSDSRKRTREQEFHQYQSCGSHSKSRIFISELNIRDTKKHTQCDPGEPLYPLTYSTPRTRKSGPAFTKLATAIRSTPPPRQTVPALENDRPTTAVAHPRLAPPSSPFLNRPHGRFSNSSGVDGIEGTGTESTGAAMLHRRDAKPTRATGETLPQVSQDRPFDIAFLSYPFTAPPIFTNLPALEDLEGSACWGIAVTGNCLTRPNTFYLWLGNTCQHPIEVVAEAFRTNLVGSSRGKGFPKEDTDVDLDGQKCTVRVGNYTMTDAIVYLVHQGEEPDELVCFL